MTSRQAELSAPGSPERRPVPRWGWVGALCWLATGGYFAVEPAVAAAWPVPYDWSSSTISALGVTTCADLPTLGYVCSPRHQWMNAAFVVTGALTAGGALLTRTIWPRRRATTVAIAFLVLTGVGAVLVGLAPADRHLPVHAIGALLQVPGSIAPLVLAKVLWAEHRRLATATLVVGTVGTLATVLYFAGAGTGLGAGALERLAFWPLTAWTSAAGAVMLRGFWGDRHG